MQTPDFQLSFLLQVLQLIRDSKSNPEVVYPLLSAHLDTLDDNFAIFLRSWVTTALSESSSDQAEDLAIAIANFSSLITEFPLGNHSNNVEIAIAGNQAAITVLTREAFPEKWATIQNNLGNAYRDRIAGERAENLEQAIAYYQKALEIRTRDAFPEQWAGTQTNLAVFYSQRLLGDRAENLEQAIACCLNALQVYTREAFPQQWAATQKNLGLLYFDRIQGDQAENAEAEISCYLAVLKVYTRDIFPEQWAQTQKNLGFAYLYRIQGEQAENLEVSIHFSLAALEVYTRDVFPQEYAETLFNLGLAYQGSGQLLNAYDTFSDTIEVIDFLRGKNADTRDTKLKLSEKWASLYQAMVETCLELAGEDKSYYAQALEYVEASKARYITETLAAENIYLNLSFKPQGDVPYKVREKLKKLRERLRNELESLTQSPLNSLPSEAITNDNQLVAVTAKAQLINKMNSVNINQIKREFDNLIKEKIASIDSTFSTNPSISYNDIQTLISPKTVILEWYFTHSTFVTFIITRQSLYPLVWESSEARLQELIDFADNYLKEYNHYFSFSGTRLEAPKNQFTSDSQWKDHLDNLLRKLAEILNLEHILTLIPKTCNELILIPHRFLHIFPLHALPTSDSFCLLDHFSGGLGYAASCGILRQIQNRNREELSNFCGIQNPDRSLSPFADIEVEAISSYFRSREVLAHERANKANLFNRNLIEFTHCLHFASHGKFDFENALESQVQLADRFSENKKIGIDIEGDYRIIQEKIKKSNLSLSEIFNLKLDACCLVVLSGCQTALTDVKSVSDEYIGLPGGFLVAGSMGVVGSLWNVSNFDTTFLMIKFYDNLIIDEETVKLALNKAQLWLRDITKGELLEWIENRPKLAAVHKETLLNGLNGYRAEDKPFKSPYHWAAFCVSGQ